MLLVCENFAKSNNLMFSNPAKSKTKYLFMCGQDKANCKYPAPLQLNGRDLPWVEKGTHLGHELHQSCTMDFDIRCKKGNFISSSTDLREAFSFVHHSQVLTAVNVYAGHFYGSVL